MTADVDPWRAGPKEGDASVLPVPGLFTDTAKVAGYAATRIEDLFLQLGIMLDAIGLMTGGCGSTLRRWSACAPPEAPSWRTSTGSGFR